MSAHEARKHFLEAVSVVHGALTAWAAAVLYGAADDDMERLTRGLHYAIEVAARSASLLRSRRT